MKIKTLIIVLSIGALLSIIAAVYGPGLSGSAVAGLMSFPFAQIGGLLRALSLAGAFGNIAAILLYAALGLAPLLLLFWRVRKKKAHLEDSLLVALSALLFFMMYLMVNPALISKVIVLGGMSGMGKAVIGGTFYSLLIGYLIFRLLRRISHSKAAEMLKWLQLIFALSAAALVFSVFYLALLGIIGNIQEVKLANTDPAVSLAMTNTFIVIRFVLQQIPVFLSVWLLILAIKLTEALKQDRYGEEAVTAAGRLGAFSKMTVAVTVICSIATNLLQLIFSKSLHTSHFSVQVPFVPLALMLIMLLLAQYFADSSRLHKDNQLFI